MWSIYKRPDGKEVKVWHVTDPSNTPSGIVAGWSQIIIQEERPLPDNPEEVYMAEYVMDGVPNEWELEGDLPEGVAPANPSIPGVHTRWPTCGGMTRGASSPSPIGSVSNRPKVPTGCARTGFTPCMRLVWPSR